MTEAQPQVLVLTAPEQSACLTDTHCETITRALETDATVAQRWLAPGEALEIRIREPAGKCREIMEKATAILTGLPIDINLLPDEGARRRKRLLIADMDSTIIEQECIDEIADFAGVRDRVSAVTESAMRGDLDFAEALNTRVALLKGLEATVLEQIAERYITIMPGAKTLVATMKANGAYAALVSGGFTYFTERIANRVGFDSNQANRLEFDEGRLTGKVVPPILGRDAKRRALIDNLKRLGIETSDALAVGDGANDLSMIKEAGLGVAYRAKPIVAAEAKASIKHGNLRALLYLQGYERGEFVE